MEAFDVVADVKPAHGQASRRLAPDHGLHVDDGQMAQK